MSHGTFALISTTLDRRLMGELNSLQDDVQSYNAKLDISKYPSHHLKSMIPRVP
jgi:hypothetical protein